MKFCGICDNMLYIGVNEKNTNELTYYCRNCGNVEEAAHGENITVLKTQLKKGEQKYNHNINEYTKLDPTLPRIYNMKCPNAGCKTNLIASGTSAMASTSASASSNVPSTEVIYIRYDNDNMKYIYMCVVCDTVWKTDDFNQ